MNMTVLHNQSDQQQDMIKKQTFISSTLIISCEPKKWKKLLLEMTQSTQLIRQLRLSSSEVSASEITVLTNMLLPNLQQLDLSNNMIGNDGVVKLVGKQWTNLKKLWLYNSGITYVGVQKLSESVLCKQLTNLNLIRNPIGTKGVQLLSKAQMPLLQILHLEQCRIGNQGARHFNKSDYPSVTGLNMGHNNIGIDGYLALYCCSVLDNVTKLSMQGNMKCIGILYLVAAKLKDNSRLLLPPTKNETIKSKFEFCFNNKNIRI